MYDEAIVYTPIQFVDKPWPSVAQLWVSDGNVHCTNAFGDAFEGAEAVIYMRACVDGREARQA